MLTLSHTGRGAAGSVYVLLSSCLALVHFPAFRLEMFYVRSMYIIVFALIVQEFTLMRRPGAWEEGEAGLLYGAEAVDESGDCDADWRPFACEAPMSPRGQTRFAWDRLLPPRICTLIQGMLLFEHYGVLEGPALPARPWGRTVSSTSCRSLFPLWDWVVSSPLPFPPAMLPLPLQTLLKPWRRINSRSDCVWSRYFITA